MESDESIPRMNRVAIADCVEDVHAVESHIEEALDRQLTMFAGQPKVLAAVQGFHDRAKSQRNALATFVNELPKEPVGNTVKNLGSILLGKAAALIDKMRSNNSAKALRDDFTAFILAEASSNMLYATATGLGMPKLPYSPWITRKVASNATVKCDHPYVIPLSQ